MRRCLLLLVPCVLAACEGMPNRAETCPNPVFVTGSNLPRCRTPQPAPRSMHEAPAPRAASAYSSA